MDYSRAAKSGRGRSTAPVSNRGRSPMPRAHKPQNSSDYQRPFATSSERGGRGSYSGYNNRINNQTADPSSCPIQYQRPILNPPFSDKKNQTNLRKIQEEALTDEQKKEFVEEKLKKSQSPFMWKPSQVKPYDDPKANYLRLRDKAKEIEEKRPFQWRHFILDLVMSYELFRMGELSQSMEIIKKLELILRDLENNMETRKDWMFGTIKEALWQVVYGSLAYLHLEKKELDKAYQVANLIKPMDDLWRRARAGMHGVRAAVSMEFGHRGNYIASCEALKAVDLDKSMGEWHFIIAKSLARMRRVGQCHEEVQEEEMRAIHKALYFDKQNPYYIVHCGQLLREKAFRMYSKNAFEHKLLETKDEKKKHAKDFKTYCKSENYKKFRGKFHAARYRYHEALQLQPENPRMLVRVAFGLMKMPPFFQDLKLISECVNKAVKLAPHNPMVQHVRGIYYERFDTDADQVVEALEKASALNNFGAAMDLIRVNYRLKQTNIIEQLGAVAERFAEPLKLQVVFAQVGSYQLFINKDIVEAVKCYHKVLDIDDHSYALKSHKPLFFWVKKPLNIFSLLIEEIDNRTQLSSFPSEHREILKKFRIRIMVFDEEEVKEGESRLGVMEILEMSREGVKHLNKYKEREVRRKERGKRPRPLWVFREGKKKKQKTSEKNKENEKNRLDSDYTRDKAVFGERFSWAATGCLSSTALVPDTKSLFANGRRDSSASSCSSYSRRSRDSSVSSTEGTPQPLTEENVQLHRRLSMMSLDDRSLSPENVQLHRRMSMMSLDDCSLSDQFGTTIKDRVKQYYANMDHIKNNPLYKSESSQSLNKGKPKGKGRDKPHRSDSTQSLNVPQTKQQHNMFPEGYKSMFGSRDSVESSRSFSFMPAFAKRHDNAEQ